MVIHCQARLRSAQPGLHKITGSSVQELSIWQLACQPQVLVGSSSVQLGYPHTWCQPELWTCPLLKSQVSMAVRQREQQCELHAALPKSATLLSCLAQWCANQHACEHFCVMTACMSLDSSLAGCLLACAWGCSAR